MRMKSFNNKVLFVDDESNILNALRRIFFNMFDVSTANSGKEGLKILEEQGPYAVVVSDMHMPEMDGVQFFKKVKELHPETVRVMLTGKADIHTAIEAVNQGNIFRFVTKPCPNATMEQVLEASFEQYRLIRAEKELLENTLKGCINVLLDIISLTNPLAFSQAMRVKELVVQMSDFLKIKNKIKIELAAMLFYTGCVTLPSRTMEKYYRNEKLSVSEAEMLRGYPSISMDLINEIPRLEHISEIIAASQKDYSAKNEKDNSMDKTVFWGGEILKIAIDFDILLCKKFSKHDAIKQLHEKRGRYNPLVLSVLADINPFMLSSSKKEMRVRIKDLEIGMVIEENIRSCDDKILILGRGQEINYINRMLLENYLKQNKIKDSILVSSFVYGSEH